MFNNKKTKTMETKKTLELTQESINELAYALSLRIDELIDDNKRNPREKRTEAIARMKALLDYIDSI